MLCIIILFFFTPSATTGPKKPSERGKIVKTTIEAKNDIWNHEANIHVSDLAAKYDLAKSSICIILKNKEAIKEVDVAKGIIVITDIRSGKVSPNLYQRKAVGQ